MKIRNNQTGEEKEVSDVLGMNLCYSQDYSEVVKKPRAKKENKEASKRSTKEQK